MNMENQGNSDECRYEMLNSDDLELQNKKLGHKDSENSTFMFDKVCH